MADKEGKKAKKKEKRPTAIKRDQQAEKRRLINKSYRSQVRTAIKTFEEAAAKKDEEQKKESLNNVYSILDKCVKKGVFKLNKASRTKARIAAKAAR